ncbi:MAG: hypothetical protein IH859_05015 [Chloroflexi bacterium]|nr:hypothetical protein [Chloroflexota bacterium]
MTIPYTFELGEVRAVPEYFLHYRGTEIQSIVGLAFGHDGLYFAPLLPDIQGTSAIYRISYDPQNEHPFILDRNASAQGLIAQKGCLGCHQLDGRGGLVGPSLDRDDLVSRLDGRLSSDMYLAALDRVDQLDQPPFVAYADARAALRNVRGLDRVQLWLEFRLQEPRFDDPNAQMPNLGLTAAEARLVAEYLLARPSLSDRAKDVIRELLPNVTWWHLIYAFIVGAGFSIAGFWWLRVAGLVDIHFRPRNKR